MLNPSNRAPPSGQSVPQRSFYSVAGRQSAFIRRRLIVPTATGFRLVHETVVRRWKPAAAWLEAERGSVLRQTALAIDARHWRSRGDPVLSEPSGGDIALAGTRAGLDAGVRNLVSWGIPLEDALVMASVTPARVLGHAGADFVLLDDDLAVVATVVGGSVVWER